MTTLLGTLPKTIIISRPGWLCIVCCDWMRLQVWFPTSVSAWQHVYLCVPECLKSGRPRVRFPLYLQGFFWIKSYWWLKIWYCSGYPAWSLASGIKVRFDWPGVSILWLGDVEILICNFFLSVAAHTLIWAGLSLRYTSILMGCKATNQETVPETHLNVSGTLSNQQTIKIIHCAKHRSNKPISGATFCRRNINTMKKIQKKNIVSKITHFNTSFLTLHNLLVIHSSISLCFLPFQSFVKSDSYLCKSDVRGYLSRYVIWNLFVSPTTPTLPVGQFSPGLLMHANIIGIGIGIGAAFRPRHLPFDAPSHTFFSFWYLW